MSRMGYIGAIGLIVTRSPTQRLAAIVLVAAGSFRPIEEINPTVEIAGGHRRAATQRDPALRSQFPRSGSLRRGRGGDQGARQASDEFLIAGAVCGAIDQIDIVSPDLPNERIGNKIACASPRSYYFTVLNLIATIRQTGGERESSHFHPVGQ
jgi:hypothetical protein